MLSHRRLPRSTSISLPFILLVGLLATLVMAGGASRADVLGQVVVRGAASAALVVAFLLAGPPDGRLPRTVLTLLAATAALPLLQLIPLPPAWWGSLPGHEVLRGAVAGDQPWRPLSIQPSATWNAAASLLVPASVVLLASAVRRSERTLIMPVLLALIGISALFGLLQFSGNLFESPFVNASAGEVSALFANRNHFAVFLAFGCLLAPVWGAWDGNRAAWRVPLAIGATLLILLLILASGSRAGLAAGVLATAFGLILARQLLHSLRRRLPRWAEPAFGVAILAIVAVVIAVSVASNRAMSIDRLLSTDPAVDMRTRALPTVIEAVRAYFPTGAGFGSFDAVFRMREPFELLKPTYFNHAHNDYLEVMLGGGILAMLLVVVALGWWAICSIRVWRRKPSSEVMLGRLGSGLLLVTFVASAIDYPARTPAIMAIVALAAAWLEWGAASQHALPLNNPDL